MRREIYSIEFFLQFDGRGFLLVSTPFEIGDARGHQTNLLLATTQFVLLSHSALSVFRCRLPLAFSRLKLFDFLQKKTSSSIVN